MAAAAANEGAGPPRGADWDAVTRDRWAWAARPAAAPVWATAPVNSPSWESFFFDHLVPNRPCVFGPTVCEGWPIFEAARRGGWLDDEGRVDIGAVVRQVGGDETLVPVTHCLNPTRAHPGPADAVALDDLPCEVPMHRFAEHLTRMRSDGDRAAARTLMYLKDWHVLRDLPKGTPPPYTCPDIFRDDYLNEFSLRTRGDDYRFVYLGPRGTRTLLHTDVLGSYSWSTSVVGRKRWTFYPPEVAPLLKDSSGTFVPDIAVAVDRKRFPHFDGAAAAAVVVEQLPGQTIFVPSGWPHQVENLDECLSVNANWVNACNLHHLMATVGDDLTQAQAEIADVREVMEGEWHEACHHMVKTNCGFDFEAVCELIMLVTARVSAELATAVDSAQATAGGELATLRSDTHRSHKVFELVVLGEVLAAVLARWDAALDRSSKIPPKFTQLADVLAERTFDLLTS